MSLSISSNDPTSRISSSDDATKTDENAKKTHTEFDFAGRAYTAVQLPTGLMSGPASKAQVVKDAQDLTSSAKKIADDLKSPDLQKLLWQGAKVGANSLLVLLDSLSVAAHAAGACEGNLEELAKCFRALGSLGKDTYDLVRAAHALKKADTPEAQAKLDGLMRDLETFGKNAAKFETDLATFAGSAPVRFATGRI
jgi:hypothetical protein